jgi:hypothetical protein
VSSIDDTEAAINAAVDGPPPEEPEAEQVESGADEPEGPRYAGKFNTDTDLEKGYLEAEKLTTQTRQELAELRSQLEALQGGEAQPEQFDVWGSLGSTMDADTEQQIAARIWENPVGMMEWAQRPEVQQQFGPSIVDRAYLTWYGNQPFQASRWLAQHTAEETINQPRQEIEQLRNDWKAERAEKDATVAFSMLTQSLPDLADYSKRVNELMEQYPLAEDHPMNQTAEGVAQYAEHLYWIARGEEFKRQEAAAAQQENPQSSAGKKARTQTRSTASPAAGVTDEEQQFLDEILAGQPGRN